MKQAVSAPAPDSGTENLTSSLDPQHRLDNLTTSLRASRSSAGPKSSSIAYLARKCLMSAHKTTHFIGQLGIPYNLNLTRVC